MLFDFGERARLDLEKRQLDKRLEKEKETGTNAMEEVKRLEKENLLLCTIAMNIVGLSPDNQKKVGNHYERYVNQRDLPNVRDLVITLLKLP